MSRSRCLLFAFAVVVALVVQGCADDPTSIQSAPFVAESADQVIEGLEQAYATQDYDLFSKLLAHDVERNAQFVFELREPTETGETEWGFDVEMSVHHRMFDPAHTEPDVPPVPLDLWLESVAITLTREGEWVEQPGFYSNDAGADGLLDPMQWRTWGARYTTDVFFAMQGELDFALEGFADFVVVEDLGKRAGEPRFWLFLWKDLGSWVPKSDSELSEDTSWSAIKGLYR